MYYLFLFTSRASAVRFSEKMRREKHRAEITSMPQSAGHGCGLAVKIYDLETARLILKKTGYVSFRGIYSVNARGKANVVKL